MKNRIVIDKKGYNFDAGLRRAKSRDKLAETLAREGWNIQADKHNQWDSLGEDEKYVLITEAYKRLKNADKMGKKASKAVKLRRSAKYDIGQHELICKVLKVSPSPDAPGDTAFEAVCALLYKINMALAAKTLKEAKEKLRIEQGSVWGIVKLYGV